MNPHEALIVAYVDIAHGNVLAAVALAEHLRAARRARNETPSVHGFAISTALLNSADLFHKVMSRGKLFKWYLKDSEETRMGLLAQQVQKSTWYDLSQRLKALLTTGIKKSEIRLHVFQEFPLLGAAVLGDTWLQDVQDIRLYVPDVHPKGSAEIAAKQVGATLYVHNEAAESRLRAGGLSVVREAPIFIQGYEALFAHKYGWGTEWTGGQQKKTWANPKVLPFAERGVPYVVKSSGSGMSAAVLRSILNGLEQAGIRDFEVHLPYEVISCVAGIITHQALPSDKLLVIERYMLALGAHTKQLASSPSESVQVVANMRQLGAQTQFLPVGVPRGTHEHANLVWAQSQGWVAEGWG